MDPREDRVGGLDDPVWSDTSLEEPSRSRPRVPIFGIAIFAILGVLDLVHGSTVFGTVDIVVAVVGSIALIWKRARRRRKAATD